MIFLNNKRPQIFLKGLTPAGPGERLAGWHARRLCKSSHRCRTEAIGAGPYAIVAHKPSLSDGAAFSRCPLSTRCIRQSCACATTPIQISTPPHHQSARQFVASISHVEKVWHHPGPPLAGLISRWRRRINCFVSGSGHWLSKMHVNRTSLRRGSRLSTLDRGRLLLLHRPGDRSRCSRMLARLTS